MAPDPRVMPLVEIDAKQVAALAAPYLDSSGVQDIVAIDGGLVNTTYRVTSAAGESVVVRLYARGGESCAREREVLAQAAAMSVAVPRVLGARCAEPLPYLAYRWIDGITFNDLRRQQPGALSSAAHSVGRLAASVRSMRAESLVTTLPRRSIRTEIHRAIERLQNGRVRHRLGAPDADALAGVLEHQLPRLEPLDAEAGVIHGDFNGRNVLVRSNNGTDYAVSGLLDWEDTAIGSPVWDVGSLFRYAHRYDANFRAAFADGYRAAGATLPPDWVDEARLVDSTRLVAILDEPDELPTVFADCRELLSPLWSPLVRLESSQRGA
jgi:aminoglycoside phosphotransferase (APT) family kinase protein